LRHVEVRADVRSTGGIQLVAGEALHDEQSLSSANRIC
jgi:hypothetical protein